MNLKFTGLDPRVLINQVPGGMISNLSSQLNEQGALDRMDEVLTEIPNVRKDLGYPPLVTPTHKLLELRRPLTSLQVKGISQLHQKLKIIF